eukprot:5717776-Amphidinium_carterae.1
MALMSWYSTSFPKPGHPGYSALSLPSGTTASPKRSDSLPVDCKPSFMQLSSTKPRAAPRKRGCATMHERPDRAVVTLKK